MSAIISINDNSLLIQQQDTVASSQGYAWLLDDDVVFDFDEQHTAVESCRLQPQQIQNRYWQQCSQTSIGANSSGVRNSADLIWRHLSAIRTNFNLDEVTFVVPSHYQQDNLQLLLGIANSSGLSPKGLVNKAVLVTQHHAQQNGEYLHIDLQLHQTVCSLVVVNKGIAKLSDIDIINDVSIQLIQDALLRQMQQSFIQNNRFDPLHYAETEQQLFNQLSIAAKNLALEGKTSLEINHDAQVHSITMDATQWNSVIEPFAKKMLAFSKANTKSSKTAHVLMQLNKLFDGIVPPTFNQAGMTIVQDSMLVQSNLVDEDSFNTDGLVYRMELPLLRTEELQAENEAAPIVRSSDTQPAVTPKENKVTHLMQAGLAVPVRYAHVKISAGQLELTRSSVSNVATMLDKQQLFILSDSQRNSLQLNDRLGSNHADGVINAIQVLE